MKFFTVVTALTVIVLLYCGVWINTGKTDIFIQLIKPQRCDVTQR